MGEYKKTLIPVITVIIMLFIRVCKRGIYVQYDIIPNYENARQPTGLAHYRTYRHVFSILSALLSPSPDLPPDTSPPPPDIITRNPRKPNQTPPPRQLFRQMRQLMQNAHNLHKNLYTTAKAKWAGI